MRPLFHPQLVNGPFGDPALYVECLYQRWALLFDAGELQRFPPGKLLKVSHVFISHTHMDHFIGLDHLIRLMLGRPKRLRLFGPAPLLDQVVSRLAAYSWNLVRGYAERLLVEVTQLSGDRMERVVLDCREGFTDPGLRETAPFEGWICKDAFFGVRATVLDHKIPCLAFCLAEPMHVHILKGRLEAWDLVPGPWLRKLREAVLRGEPDETLMQVAPLNRGPLPLGWLRDHFVRTGPGQRIAYVVDAGCGERNGERIVSLAGGANLLFIEAVFLHEDLDRAEATAHLTAFEAGRLAAEAGVQKVVPFHFSPKYTHDGQRVLAEVERGFRAVTLLADPG